MKLPLMITALVASLLAPHPSHATREDSQDRSDDKQALTEKTQAADKPEILVDIDGKRLREGEEYLADRTLSNGQTIAYRKSKREVEALVKALKEDGITDRSLLDPEAWLSAPCQMSTPPQCTGNCGTATACRLIKKGEEPQRLQQPTKIKLIVRYCGCL